MFNKLYYLIKFKKLYNLLKFNKLYSLVQFINAFHSKIVQWIELVLCWFHHDVMISTKLDINWKEAFNSNHHLSSGKKRSPAKVDKSQSPHHTKCQIYLLKTGVLFSVKLVFRHRGKSSMKWVIQIQGFLKSKNEQLRHYF